MGAVQEEGGGICFLEEEEVWSWQVSGRVMAEVSCVLCFACWFVFVLLL